MNRGGSSVPPPSSEGGFVVQNTIIKGDAFLFSTLNVTAWYPNWFNDLKDQFELTFIDGKGYKQLITGFQNTLKITFGALLIGIVIGIVIAAVRSTYDKNAEKLRKKGGIGYILLSILNAICKLYLTVIRGTPVVVQLMIAYFIIFVSVRDGVPIGILAFGINSGAYVAEIFRGGIMSIDNGQFEAGRSLGLNYIQTMTHIIIPQMFKAVLPTLCNEFIALLKETSVAGYVGVVDLTKAGNAIAGRTYSYFMPLITVALVYLVIVIVLTKLVSILERRLRNSER